MNLPRPIERWPARDLRRIDLLIRDRAARGRGLGSRAIRLLTEFGLAEAKGAETVDVVSWHHHGPRQHPPHDEIESTVGSWYREPAAEFTVELPELGWCRQPSSTTPSATPNVTVCEVPLARLGAALAEAGDWLGTNDFRLVLDDRDLLRRSRAGVERPGWERRGVTIYLCHLRAAPPDSEDVVLRQVGRDDAEMAEWVRRRSQAFANADWVRPAAADLAIEIRQRRLQEADGAEMFLVDRAGAPAGILAWYDGPDRFVCNLAVLPDQRGHGVGAALMARAIAGAERSVLVSTHEEDGPVDLYRRWGFTDEVYRPVTCRRAHR